MVQGPARSAKTGTIVVLVLLGIGAFGIAAVQIWLRRPGGKEVRDAGAAYRQLVEIGGILQRHYRNHQAFPESLDDLARRTDPVTRAAYAPAELFENPWGGHLAIESSPPDRAIVRSTGPGIHLVLTVEKGDRSWVEVGK